MGVTIINRLFCVEILILHLANQNKNWKCVCHIGSCQQLKVWIKQLSSTSNESQKLIFWKNILEFITKNQTYSSFIESLLIMVTGEVINGCNRSTSNKPKLLLS